MKPYLRLWPNIGSATIVLAALAGAWVQTGPKSALADAWKPADQNVILYTKDKPPATPRLEDLKLTESVSRWGVTWTFEKPARVGQFVNGDFYVLGPVTVVKINPAPRYGKEVAADELDGREKVAVDQRCRNGSMLNTPARREVAWDSGIMNYYHPEHRARLPIAMTRGDSLASSISLRRGEKVTYPYHAGTVRGEGDNSPVKIVAVLTCVAEPLPPDAFCPGYAGHDRTIYLARDLRRDLLPRFERPASAPDPLKIASLIERPWCDSCFFSFDVPQQSMPNYAQANAQCLADSALLACCEAKPTDKERLLINVVQIGIDYYSLVRQGHPGWAAHGGHGSGRKFPIVFAGVMLGDESMANINESFPKAAFGEDEQTAYGDCWTGAKVVFTGHSGIDVVTGIGRDFVRGGNPWGPYEHLPPSRWVPEEFRSDAYRRANTSTCWVAQALVLRAMKLESTWNHDAFFDYVDRWMFEDDKPFRIEIAKYCRPPYSKDVYLDDSKDWFHEGYADQPWIKQLWDKYRPLSPAASDGWKQKHDDDYYRNAVAKQRK